jgi:hypothetical protein
MPKKPEKRTTIDEENSSATTVRSAAAGADPFKELLELPPVKMPARKRATEPKAKPKAVKKAPAKTEKTFTIDPFAEVARASSQVKEPAAKTVARSAGRTKKGPGKSSKATELDATSQIAATEPKVRLSPVFKVLAEPMLPVLERENRARLLMQTPTRLYFYWSIKENPYQLLHKAFGDDTGGYTLVLRLTNTRTSVEEMHPVDAEGNWWFDVDAGGEYQAEIGFYAPNRPYFRLIYSNKIETPRRNPSPRPANEAQWTVSANKFAKVLDASGFSRDAFDVALVGDDHQAAEEVTRGAFSRFIGSEQIALEAIAAEDIRYAMTALAAGVKLEELRWKIGPTLFAILQANAEKLAAENARAALGEYMDVDDAEYAETEDRGHAVFGASLVNFPRTLKTRGIASKYAPVSSSTGR